MTPTRRFRDDDRFAALALAGAPGVGPAGYRTLVERYGSPRAALGALRPHDRAMCSDAAERVLNDCHRCGAVVILESDGAYPAPLRDLAHPPSALFAMGSVAACSRPMVSIVGTRGSTAYGERVAREIAGSLARAGVVIVSGMARGIDAASHHAALAAGAPTIAVLGTGIDVPYPVAHRALHRRIVAGGLALSERPPGTTAHAGAFPRRNRLIAALGSATIVVEAGARSGALLTAGHALELGRTVAAVPGPIDSPASAGTNELLRDGAVVIASVADALALVGVTPAVRTLAPDADADQRAVWQALERGADDLDSLTARAGLPARRCLAAVTALELSGAVECALTGEVRRRIG